VILQAKIIFLIGSALALFVYSVLQTVFSQTDNGRDDQG
jgi:hypothetical protein